MRHLLLTAALVALAACSPTTDISRTSTELAAGREPYAVVERQPSGDTLRITMRVASWAAARTVAEDVAVRAREPYQRIEVRIEGPGRAGQGSRTAVLTWSQAGGFSYAENQ